MNCGNCPFTDGLCYTSLPPQVKCTITNEFHYYGDECNCVEAMTSRKAELDFAKNKLDEPCALIAINYDGPNAPAVSFYNDITREEAAAAYESLLNLPLYGEGEGSYDNKISIKPMTSTIELDEIDKRFLEPPFMYAVRCLVCDTEVPVQYLGGGPMICHACKKAIKFIKDKFNKELESYEV